MFACSVGAAGGRKRVCPPLNAAGELVLNAVKNVNEVIAPAVIGMNVADQVGIDKAMIALDGTPTRSFAAAKC